MAIVTVIHCDLIIHLLIDALLIKADKGESLLIRVSLHRIALCQVSRHGRGNRQY